LRDRLRADVAEPLVHGQLFLAADAQRLVQLATSLQNTRNVSSSPSLLNFATGVSKTWDGSTL